MYIEKLFVGWFFVFDDKFISHEDILTVEKKEAIFKLNRFFSVIHYFLFSLFKLAQGN